MQTPERPSIPPTSSTPPAADSGRGLDEIQATLQCVSRQVEELLRGQQEQRLGGGTEWDGDSRDAGNDVAAVGRQFLSFLVVAHNEDQTIYELATRIAEQVPPQWDYEILLIDDGSDDKTWGEIERIVENPPECNCGTLRAIRFRRGIGRAGALNIGFAEARGDLIFTLEADLEDDPGEIPRYLEQIDRGADVVTGRRCRRHGRTDQDPRPFFNRTLSLLTGVRLHDHDCGFRCYRREVVDGVHLYGETYRMLPSLAAMQGYRTCELPITAGVEPLRVAPRRGGGIGRGISDAVSMAFLLRYRERPAHLIHGATALFVLAAVWLASAGIRAGTDATEGILLCLGSAIFVAFAWLTFLGGVFAELFVRAGRMQNLFRPMAQRISSRPCRERPQP